MNIFNNELNEAIDGSVNALNSIASILELFKRENIILKAVIITMLLDSGKNNEVFTDMDLNISTSYDFTMQADDDFNKLSITIKKEPENE